MRRWQCRARLLSALSSALLAGVTACVSDQPEVSTAFDPLTRFPAEATWVWDEAANRAPDDPRIRELDFERRLRALTTEALAARGYHEVESEPADFRVSYQLSVDTWISPDHSTSVGSLSIVLVDATSRRRVWMGFGRAEIRIGLPEAERDQRLRRVLDRMFESFPPNQAG